MTRQHDPHGAGVMVVGMPTRRSLVEDVPGEKDRLRRRNEEWYRLVIEGQLGSDGHRRFKTRRWVAWIYKVGLQTVSDGLNAHRELLNLTAEVLEIENA